MILMNFQNWIFIYNEIYEVNSKKEKKRKYKRKIIIFKKNI